MANNAGMGVFSMFHTQTYTELTNEFLASFQDTLEDEDALPMCTFSLGGELRSLTLQKSAMC